jgi:hypothetical protein
VGVGLNVIEMLRNMPNSETFKEKLTIRQVACDEESIKTPRHLGLL